VEWIHLAQVRDCWLALVSAVMNFRVLAPQNRLVTNDQINSFAYLCLKVWI
jgi:hypothetical protein